VSRLDVLQKKYTTMNSNCLIWIFAATSLLAPTLTAEDKKGRAETWLRNWVDFDPTELRALVDKPTGERDNRMLMELILQAGVEKDGSFQDLLKRGELREANNVDLALSAYDYMLNKSEIALNRILAQLATEDIARDENATLVLAFVDEWDRSIRAVRKHFYRTDGMVSKNQHFFLTTRAYLYPEKYAEMQKAIEAPVIWGGRLLPEEP